MSLNKHKRNELTKMPYQIPRNVKGEGRILFIFSTKALIYTCIGGGIGLVFWWILDMIGAGTVGIVLIILFALIGFGLGTLKVPNSVAFEITRKTGGENLDDVIMRWLKFKMTNKKKIYVYTEGGTKDDR